MNRRKEAGKTGLRQKPVGISVSYGLLLCAVFSLLATASVSAADAPYPAKPIRLVVPFAPGGGADLMARAIGQQIGPGLRQPVVIENRAGAGGKIGAEIVAKAAPDGYTLLLATTSTLIWAPAMNDRLNYNPSKDFAAVAPFSSASTILVVHPSVPAKSVGELIALARAKPGRLNYASSGAGAPAHLGAELFNHTADIKTTHVAYKGSAPGTIAVLSGETDMMFSNILPALPHVQSGKLRPLAVTSLKRSSVLPNVMTMSEAGMPGFEVYVFYGIAAPTGTPRAIIDRLHEEISKAARLPQVRDALIRDGAEPMLSESPDQFKNLIAAENEKWFKLIRQAGIREN